MNNLNYNELDLIEGMMHNALFTTGVGNVGPQIRAGDGKVTGMKLVNNGSLVQLTLKNQANPKRPFVALVHIVNFTSVTVKESPRLEIIKASVLTNETNSKT